jgi:cytochrome c oxidase assembly factor CtaG
VHLVVHAHVVVSGTLFLAVLVGVDALPGRPPPGARLLALLVAVPHGKPPAKGVTASAGEITFIATESCQPW